MENKKEMKEWRKQMRRMNMYTWHSQQKGDLNLTHNICTFMFRTSEMVCGNLWKHIQYKQIRNTRSKKNTG